MGRKPSKRNEMLIRKEEFDNSFNNYNRLHIEENTFIQ